MPDVWRMKDEMPTPYPVWPSMGFEEWRKAMEESHCGQCGEGIFTEEDGRCDVCWEEPR